MQSWIDARGGHFSCTDPRHGGYLSITDKDGDVFQFSIPSPAVFWLGLYIVWHWPVARNAVGLTWIAAYVATLWWMAAAYKTEWAAFLTTAGFAALWILSDWLLKRKWLQFGWRSHFDV